jgi:hypothetical protein
MTENRDHRCYDQLFIGGHWRKPSTEQRLTVISPHSEAPIGDAAAAAPEDVDAAVAAARHAFDHGPWPRLDPHERMRKVEELATIYSGHLDEMADLITDEMGSPRSFISAWQSPGTFRGPSAAKACWAKFTCVGLRSAWSARSCRGTCRSS